MLSIKSYLCALLLATPSLSAPAKQNDLTSFIATEKPIALNGILANIGSTGALSGPLGAADGVVIASPSTVSFHCAAQAQLPKYN